jgi:hypothetical protein
MQKVCRWFQRRQEFLVDGVMAKTIIEIALLCVGVVFVLAGRPLWQRTARAFEQIQGTIPPRRLSWLRERT